MSPSTLNVGVWSRKINLKLNKKKSRVGDGGRERENPNENRPENTGAVGLFLSSSSMDRSHGYWCGIDFQKCDKIHPGEVMGKQYFIQRKNWQEYLQGGSTLRSWPIICHGNQGASICRSHQHRSELAGERDNIFHINFLSFYQAFISVHTSFTGGPGRVEALTLCVNQQIARAANVIGKREVDLRRLRGGELVGWDGWGEILASASPSQARSLLPPIPHKIRCDYWAYLPARVSPSPARHHHLSGW